jgi:hypothetical protein
MQHHYPIDDDEDRLEAMCAAMRALLAGNRKEAERILGLFGLSLPPTEKKQ